MVDGHPAPLGARAFDLLLALVERRDRTVTKNELLDLVWPGLVVEENNLQVQISTLRKVLGQNAIATIPGQGYRSRCGPRRPRCPCHPRSRWPTTRSRIRSSKRRCPSHQRTPMVQPATAQAARRARPACPQGNCDGQRFPPQRFFSSCWRRCHGITGNPHRKPPTRPVVRCGGAAPWFSIAILPFAAPGGAATNAQLADSLTRDLTVAFGRARWAQVVSYALASTYKGKAIDARLIGRDSTFATWLRARPLAGEVFIADIRLIDTGTATQVWSNRSALERGSAEQDRGALVTALTQQLRAALVAAERRRIGTQSAIHPDAMELVVRAANVWGQESDPLKGALEARKLYDEALRLDPNLVWALLGRGWTWIPNSI